MLNVIIYYSLLNVYCKLLNVNHVNLKTTDTKVFILFAVDILEKS